MAEQPAHIAPQPVKKTRLLLPVLLSLGISGYLLATAFKPAVLASVPFTSKLVWGLVLALVALFVRDAAFVYKVRLSSGEKFTWRQAVNTVIMWEFGATISPKLSEVAFTLFVLKRSGLTLGRSTALIGLNVFLDNLVFVVMFGVLYLFMGRHILFVEINCNDLQGEGLMQKLILAVRHFAEHAWIGYAFFCGVTAFFGIGLFALPNATKKFFMRLSKVRFLSRFQNGIRHLGEEIEITAYEYKNQTWWFWGRMLIATTINWTARYAIVNAMVFACSATTPNMAEVFARQFVLWMFLIIPSPPGAAGWAEIAFMALNCEFVPAGLIVPITFVWRIYTFYLYMLLGNIVMPGWLKKTEPKPGV